MKRERERDSSTKTKPNIPINRSFVQSTLQLARHWPTFCFVDVQVTRACCSHPISWQQFGHRWKPRKFNLPKKSRWNSYDFFFVFIHVMIQQDGRCVYIYIYWIGVSKMCHKTRNVYVGDGQHTPIAVADTTQQTNLFILFGSDPSIYSYTEQISIHNIRFS